MANVQYRGTGRRKSSVQETSLLMEKKLENI